MKQNGIEPRTAALAGAVASAINDELTVILNSVACERVTREDRAAVESASLRCAAVAKGLMLFAHRHGVRRVAPWRSLIEEDLF